MSFFFAPKYQIWLYQPAGYGQSTIVKTFTLNSLIRADLSMSVTNTVNTASFQISDIDGTIWRDVAPQPMDIIQIYSNSPKNSTPVVIWTGFLDAASVQYDPEAGNVVLLNATSAWKLFEVTRFMISNSLNDAFSLAALELKGIGARDLIKFAAARSKYPGPLGSLIQPAGLQFYTGPEIAGQEIWTMPDNIGTEPDMQTWAAVLGALSTDTGCELYFDEFSSLVFRPVGFLQTTPPRLIQPEDILNSTLGITDQNVITSVRVRWFASGSYAKDGYWYAGQSKPSGSSATVTTGSMQTHLGTRELTIQAPWIKTQDAANFLAQAVGQMSAANVGVGTVSIPCDPAFKIGTLVQMPALTPGAGYSVYYISGVVDSLEWNGSWVRTLTLAYGRDPSQTFPYQVQYARAIVSNKPNYYDAKGVFNPNAVSSGVPGYNTGAVGYGAGFTLGGAQTIPLVVKKNTSLTAGQVQAPYPAGTVIRISDQAGNPYGEFTVTYNTTATDSSVQLLNPGKMTTTGPIVIVSQAVATAQTTASSSSSYTSTAGGTSSVPNAGPNDTTPSQFQYWPVAGGNTIPLSQDFGPTTFTAETKNYQYVGPSEQVSAGGPYITQGTYYPLFHTGIDIPVGLGTPVFAPISGVIQQASWDTTGYGNLIILKAGNLWIYFGHLQKFNVSQGDSITVNAPVPSNPTGSRPVIGYVNSTGNSTGNHLHFGVFDTTLNNGAGGYVDPKPFLRTAQP